MSRSGRLDDGRTSVIGLDFFPSAVSWSLDNSSMPIFLRRCPSNAVVVGFIMTLDNWAAIVIQPWIGALGDRSRTRLGRRMPYLVAGIPVAGAFLVAIPLLASGSGGAKPVLFAFALAQIVSPPLLGALIDRAGMRAPFPAGLEFMVLAALLMLGVRRGESEKPAESGARPEGGS